MDAQNGLTAINLIGPLTGNVTGNINGTIGTLTNLTVTNPIVGSINGNAATATTATTANKLTTATTINTVSFDGSTPISFTTDKVNEGTNNLYYTVSRVSALIANSLTNYLTTASLSVTSGIATGNTTLTYNTTTGVFNLLSANVSLYTTTATVNTLIANSLTNYVTTTSLATSVTTKNLIVGPGTTSLEPISILPGPIQTSGNLAAGDMEYDGTTLYFTPSDSQRGVIHAEQTYVLNSNYSQGSPASGTATSLFGVGVSLSTGTRYEYHCRFVVLKVGNFGNTPTLGWSLGGTAVLSAHGYQVLSSVPATETTVSATDSIANYITTGFTTAVTFNTLAASTSAGIVDIRGYIDVITGGTVIPQITYTYGGTLTSINIQALSGMRIFPVSSTGTNTIVGTWA
jgi:hypothetical protein